MENTPREDIVREIRKNGYYIKKGIVTSKRLELTRNGEGNHGLGVAERVQTPEESFNHSLSGEALRKFKEKIAKILQK